MSRSAPAYLIECNLQGAAPCGCRSGHAWCLRLLRVCEEVRGSAMLIWTSTWVSSIDTGLHLWVGTCLAQAALRRLSWQPRSPPAAPVTSSILHGVASRTEAGYAPLCGPGTQHLGEAREGRAPCMSAAVQARGTGVLLSCSTFYEQHFACACQLCSGGCAGEGRCPGHATLAPARVLLTKGSSLLQGLICSSSPGSRL